MIRGSHCRTAALCVALLASAVIRSTTTPAAQDGAAPVLYVLPLWEPFATADEETVTREIGELRRRLGPETSRVRLGFTSYVFLSMADWHVDVSDPAAVRRAMAPNIADIDRAVDRARRHGIPLCLSFMTAVRERYDPLQKAAEQEDRRNTQWYADNAIASGWMTHSRYARRHRIVLEAYVRELGRIVANRMAKYPETLVAASGDGEVELAYGKSPIAGASYTLETMQLADYSPFAVAEFRDWLRGDGLYAARGPFGAEAYDERARYQGDRSPADDTNHDGHTLNGDFGTRFTTWQLRSFDWALTDDPGRDTHAIPAKQYSADGWTMPIGLPGGFDPPRAWAQGNPWWEVWHRFRQTMIWRHNRDISRWMTTSPDPETRATVPATRWYSDQIPADYLHGSTPAEPNLRAITSASAWWTADVTPFARLGITSFNANVNGALFRTLAGVAPRIGERDVDWGILEWNPSSPSSSDPDGYRAEMHTVQLYRPSLLVPVYWNATVERLKDTGFEIALKELVAAVSRGDLPPELSVSPRRLTFARTAGGRVTPPEPIHVQIAGRGRLAWTATPGSPAIAVATPTGTGNADVAISLGRSPARPGEPLAVTIDAPGTSGGHVSVPVRVIDIPGNGAPPFGSVDAPGEGTAVGHAFDISGWALDDIGVSAIEVWREPEAGESATANGLVKVEARFRDRTPRGDVEKLFPDAPLNDRAGWGARAALPSPVKGRVRLHVLVTDVDGHVQELGVRSVVVLGVQ